MNIPKIVIRRDEMIDTVKDAIGESNLYVEPYGIYSNNEVSDYRVKGGDRVNYHIHRYGYELFTILSGSVECALGGKRCMAYPGDMILVRPFVPHAFIYREDHTVWQEIVVALSLYENERSFGRLVQNCPEKIADRDFMAAYQAHNGRTDYYDIPAMEAEEISAAAMPFLVRKADCYKSYKLPGIQMRLKFGRWDLGGLKELWEFEMEKGFTMRTDFVYSPDEFIVKNGSVRVEVQNIAPQIARTGDVIHIPNYTQHSITALEEGTVLHDCNCQMHLLMMMEEYALNSANAPSLVNNREYLEGLMKKYDCPITWAGVLA
jgi:quercetin dioxygenase-like cupin family protein